MDSAELIDMMAGDAPSSEVADAIKSLLYAKTASDVEEITPDIAVGMFGDEIPDEGDPLPEVGDGFEQPEAEVDPVDTVEQEPEQEEE
tara:strand:- start:43 stop:306 length:264 start_codon:yes stop_codon:yes gene_type:complete